MQLKSILPFNGLDFNACKEDQISFAADSDGDGNWLDSDDNYYNSGTPSDLSCYIFNPAGGGVPYYAPDTEWLDIEKSARPNFGNYFFGLNCTDNVGTSSAGNCAQDAAFTQSSGDLLMIIPMIKQEICIAIQRKLHGSDAIFTDGGNFVQHDDYYTGSYLVTVAYNSGGDSVVGEIEGCVMGSGAGTYPDPTEYFYFRVLIPR